MPYITAEKHEQLRSLLQQMLDVAENADETGYVADVGFVNLDKLHAKVRDALNKEPRASRRKGAQVRTVNT